MQSNDLSHAARNFKYNLGSNWIFCSRLTEKPPTSPDINHIENFWGIVKWKANAAHKENNAEDDLWRAVLRAINDVDEETF